MATAAEIVASQQAFALATIAESTNVLNTLNDLAQSSFYFVPASPEIPSAGYNFDTTTETKALLRSLFPEGLTVDAVSALLPTFTPTAIGELEDTSIPEMTTTAPVLEMPDRPDTTLPTIPAQPDVKDITVPTAPVLSMPVAPTLDAIALPSVPSVALPYFDATAPVDDLVTPTNTFAFYEVAYSSALLDELQSKLLDNLQNGGYGIETSDEIALFNRARDREIEAMMSRIEDAGRLQAARGFPLPPGELSIHIDRAYQDMQDKVSSVSRDIALKRADLYVANRQFTIEQSKAVEQILIGYHNSLMERTLNAAKATVEVAISIYNTQIARFNARLDAYKTEASVFEARIRAALSQVEIYRVTMEGAKIASDIQRARVEIYNAQLNGVNAVINLYKAQMEAAQIQATIERVRIDSFQALIQAYVAQVQAKVAEFNMFEAGVKGEMARVQAYEAETRAFSARVDAAKTAADIKIARLKAQLETAGQEIEVYKARMLGYKTDIDGQVSRIDALTKVYGAQVQGASAETTAVGEAIRLDLSAQDLEFKRNAKNADILIEGAQIILTSLVKSAEARIAAATAGSKFYEALAAGATNSLTALAAEVNQTGTS